MAMESAAKVAQPKPVRRGPKGGTRVYARSAVTNGTVILPDLADERSSWVRRIRDVIAEFASDFPEPSAAERTIIKRISTLIVVLEQFESRFANRGEASGNELDDYQRAAGNLRRLLESLGIKGRRAKDITPTLADIAAEIRAAKPEGDAS
jgi:hypothetical protein